MAHEKLTMQNVLRYSNHDLLNHLHLIQMNLSLNRVEETKNYIEQVAESCHNFSKINKLGLDQTALWLQTFRWRFSAIQLTTQCMIEQPANIAFDTEIEQCLENTIIHLYDVLDPYTEQQLIISIRSLKNDFLLEFKLTGKWDRIDCTPIENNEMVHILEWNEKIVHFEIAMKE